MLVHRIPALNRLLFIKPHELQIVLAEDGRARLSLLLPPVEELIEIQTLSSRNISLKEKAADTSVRLAQNFREELQRVLAKREQYSKSPTYLTHLANLAELAGDVLAEHEFLLEAEKLSGSSFFTHRRGVNLIAQGRAEGAEYTFKQLDLDHDVGANLRLAYLYVCRESFNEALQYVDKAVSIDPIDFGARMFQGALALARGDARRALHSFRIAAEERVTSSLYSNMAIAYIRLGQPEKALASLKTAVQIEPFNENAVSALADLAFSEKRDKEAVGPLERYVEFEQRSASIWGRLARALLEAGAKQKALDALKRQASVEESASVYNNIGVTYSRLGNKRRAAEYFSFAMRKAKNTKEEGYLLAARNLLSTLAETERFVDLVAVGKEVLKTDDDFAAARDKLLSDIYVLFTYGVARSGKLIEAERFALRLWSDVSDAHPRLRTWIASWIISAWSLRKNKRVEADALAKTALTIADNLDRNDERRVSLRNNIAFLLIELGKAQEAANLLSEISRWIHKEPYPTATLGLLQLRKGRLEKGEKLYREALRLTRSAYDKDRIAQKMNLELGRCLMNTQTKLARRYLTKALRDFPVTEELTKEAQELLSVLPHPKK